MANETRKKLARSKHIKKCLKESSRHKKVYDFEEKKSTRGRTNTEADKYTEKSNALIADWNLKILVPNNTAEVIKSLKNKISALQSRVTKKNLEAYLKDLVAEKDTTIGILISTIAVNNE